MGVRPKLADVLLWIVGIMAFTMFVFLWILALKTFWKLLWA